MSKPRDNRHKDLFRPALDQIIDLGHPLVRLAREIDWGFLDERFSSVCRSGAGQPPLPTRLVAGLLILKHMHDLSDEALCARWVENPYYQFFCGEESFQHALRFERSSLTRWRQRLGEEQLVALLQESFSVAHKTGALASKDLERVVVDTTVQPKAIAFPTDARLLHKAIVRLGRLAKVHDVPLRQSYVRVSKQVQGLDLGPSAPGLRPLILVGDGAFQMTGWEIGNCRRYDWDPIVMVFNNASWEMLRVFQPESRFNDLDDWHFAELAKPLGGTGERVTTRAELKSALDRAVATRGQFYLIEIMLERGALSNTLTRYVAGLKRGQGNSTK